MEGAPTSGSKPGSSGLTLRQVADRTGLSYGYVTQVAQRDSAT